MAEKDEANLGGESTDRRKFLAGVAAATAATVAAGASEAYAAPIEDAGKKTERKTVAVAEGVLHKTHGEVTEIEIMDNYRIEIESESAAVSSDVPFGRADGEDFPRVMQRQYSADRSRNRACHEGDIGR
ncbi:MAG: hypothetical protein AABP62_21925 [Planctomycetota bacterium]